MYKIAGFLFIALSAIIYTAERVSEKISSALHTVAAAACFKSQTAVSNGRFYEIELPNFSKCFENPVIWVCFIIGLLLIIFGPKTIKKEAE